MAISSSEEVRQLSQLELMGHLFRRAGFGATRDELEATLAKGYEATREGLLHPEQAPDLEEDLLFRSFPDFHETRKVDVAAAVWVWRMIHTQRPLEEKMTLFWLDNQLNTKDVHNENDGRELLELFSMGIGNYTEDDVKHCARAFTGWTFRETVPVVKPYGRFLSRGSHRRLRDRISFSQ